MPSVDLSSDTIPPTTILNKNPGFYNSPQTILLICDDGDGSGCKKSYYKVNQKACDEVSASNAGFQVYSSALTLDQEGVICLEYYSRDNATTASTTDSRLPILDKGDIDLSRDSLTDFNKLQ